MEDLLKEYNTPFYVFDVTELNNRVNYIRSRFNNKIKLCYAIKANPFVISKLENFIDRVEVCSQGEYYICKNNKILENKLVISGVNKEYENMQDIVFNDNVGLYTIESIRQIEMLNDLSNRKRKKIKILLRLTSGNQFGLTESEIKTILENRIKYKFLNIVGIQYFSGTQKSLKKIEKEIKYLDNFLKTLKFELGYEIEELEYGPGLKVEYFETDNEFNEDYYLSEINNLLLSMDYKGTITLEIGRSIVASCGIYYTRVVDLKKNEQGNFAILDGGIHHLVYYGQLMAIKKPIYEIISKKQSNKVECWNLCGSLCTINDLIAKNVEIKDLKLNDIFAFKNVGAYSMTEGISLFLSRKLPKILCVEDNKVEILRDEIDTYKLNMYDMKGDK